MSTRQQGKRRSRLRRRSSNALTGNRGRRCWRMRRRHLRPAERRQRYPQCPSIFSGLRQWDVPAIASCQPIHTDACREVSGARYDTLEVRSFNQTGQNSGLLCQDTSMESMKNGVSFVADPGRASCLEVHQWAFKWRTNYNKSARGIDFGAFVQCQGQMAQ
jgi:hypothetical protein